MQVRFGEAQNAVEGSGLAPAAIARGNSYTFNILDLGNRVSAEIEANITECALYVIDLVSRYVSWEGTMDFVVDIRPDSETPYPNANGILPSVAQISWRDGGWFNDTLSEALTGVDLDTSRPDAGCFIYLAEDGSIRNYNVPVWFDPDPEFGMAIAEVPAGMHDFAGIYTHEIFHSLGFYNITSQWQEMLTTANGLSLFHGENVERVLGGPLTFLEGSDHYGNFADSSVTYKRGLMYQYGNYDRNRWDIGQIDLAVLADLGYTIKSWDGLPTFELLDNALNLGGTSGNDTLYGDFHANSLEGFGGADSLYGGYGVDFLNGGAGADMLAGGEGDDLYIVENALDKVVEAAGQGRDSVSAHVSFKLADNVEDLLLVGAAANGTGNMLANMITGNAAANQLDGGAGGDRMNGGDGNDIYVVDEKLDLVIEDSAAGGTDIVRSSIGYLLGDNVEKLTLTGAANINGSGNALANSLTGNSGANVLNGKAGADQMAGGGGDDIYHVDDLGDTVSEVAGGGVDTVKSNVGFELGANVENLALAGAADATATGNALANRLTGNIGMNILKAGAGADILDGGADDDRLFGGAGVDTLTGGAGKDRFYFDAPIGAEVDAITDFSSADDAIFLSRAVFTAFTKAAVAPSAFVVGTAAQDAGDRIVYDQASGKLFYDADGTGAGAAVLFATVTAGTAMTSADFVTF